MIFFSIIYNMIEKNISPLEEHNHVGIIELSNKRDWFFLISIKL